MEPDISKIWTRPDVRVSVGKLIVESLGFDAATVTGEAQLRGPRGRVDRRSRSELQLPADLRPPSAEATHPEAVELATTVLAVRDQIAPPTINYRVPGPECDLNYVLNAAAAARIRAAIPNSFGFGGHNECLLVREIAR